MLSANRRVGGRVLTRTICLEVAENGYVKVIVSSFAYVCVLLAPLRLTAFHCASVTVWLLRAINLQSDMSVYVASIGFAVGRFL